MFGFGHGPELIIILVIALIVLGPGKIPEIAQTMGKAVRELRKASAELQQTFDVNQIMNPPEPPAPAPPPVEAVAATQDPHPDSLPEGEARVKPKRVRKPKGGGAEGSEDAMMSSGSANGAAPEADGKPPSVKPRIRRRASKQAPEAVTLDA